jgi:hypothetical protein
MIISATDKAISATHVKVTEDTLSVDLEDGRTISVPLDWYPRLVRGTVKERNTWKIGPVGIHWPELDEDISIAGLLAGRPSGESQVSLKRWLDQRAAKNKKSKK